MKSNPPNILLGMIGTTLGGGMIGGGIQRTYLVGNRLSSAVSKLAGKSGLSFDNATWFLLAGGLVVLALGVYFSLQKK